LDAYRGGEVDLSRKRYLAQDHSGKMYFGSPKTVLNIKFPQKCNLEKYKACFRWCRKVSGIYSSIFFGSETGKL